MASQDYAKTLTSFSGSDLVVNFGPKTIGELQQISWGVKREKAPVFTLGSPDARSFSRGKRGIGGSLVMAQYNRDALMEELVDDEDVWKQIAPAAMFTAAGNLAQRGTENFEYAMNAAGWGNKIDSTRAGSTSEIPGITVGEDQFGFTGDTQISAGTTVGNDGSTTVRVPPGFAQIRAKNVIYADMIPPFDSTMTFANEYGQAAFQKIYDIDIMDEQSGVSVDSIVMERAMSYVARRISPLMTGVYDRATGGNVTGKNVYA
jgi:hypothetical protein